MIGWGDDCKGIYGLDNEESATLRKLVDAQSDRITELQNAVLRSDLNVGRAIAALNRAKEAPTPGEAYFGIEAAINELHKDPFSSHDKPHGNDDL